MRQTAGAKIIGIYGGSFDPVHKGHVSVVKSVLSDGAVNEVWITPAAQSPFKHNGAVCPFRHRSAMLKLAFQDEMRVRVCEIEQELPKPSFTLQTLRTLRAKYPAYSFMLCLGSDNLRHFTAWHGYDEILKTTKLLVALRPAFSADAIPKEVLKSVQFLNHQPVAVSSTDAREKLRTEQFSHDVPDEVSAYIKAHKLYET